jgi:arginyl-tRNA synthetase
MKHNVEEILFKVVGENIDSFEVFVPEKEEFGHFSTNVAMRLAKSHDKSSLEFAKELVEKVKIAAPAGFFEKVDVAPPGFINFWLTSSTIQEEFKNVFADSDRFGKNDIGKNRTVVVEYSQPNIAKMMHVGHLRTTIIGDALANILESVGYKVIRWNYLGDWGTQFGKLIAAYKMWGDEEVVQKNPITELQRLYVRFHEEVSGNPDLEKQGQDEFKKLENGDEENRKLWEWFKSESLKEFEKMYIRLGVRFDTYIGESFFEGEMKSLVVDLVERGIVKRSEGALVVPLDQLNLPPALVQKSDGASLYLTRDIANIKYRLKKYNPVKILYVVGNEQSFHFIQLFAVAKILGLDSAELIHVKYGLVLGEDFKKLATREGRTILLQEVLDKAVALAEKTVLEKNPNLSAEERAQVAEAVGVGALKYNDLKENRNSDIIFNWERMLDLTGDSGPYLQYSYARLRSILRKAGKLSKYDFSNLNEPTELGLMRKVFEFPDEVVRSSEMLITSNLAVYLYKLAGLVNRLYETTPVLKEENEDRRKALLALIDIASTIIKNGMSLLGMKAPEKI